jgi:hypothetical protein
MKNKIIKIFNDNGISVSENQIEKLASSMQESIEAIADKVESEEPHATVTINELRYASGSVYSELTIEK